MALTAAEEARLRELLQGRSDILGGEPFEDFIKNAQRAKAVLDGLEASGQDLRNEFKSLGAIFGESINELKNGKFYIGEINKAYRTLYSIANQFKYEMEGINDLSLKDVRNLKAKTAQQISYLTQLKKQEGLSAELTARIEEELQFAQELLIVEKNRIKQLEEYNRNLGLSGQLFNSISKTLSDLGVDSEIIKGMGEELQEASKKGKVGFKELIPIIKNGLTEALKDPLVQFALGLKLIKSGINDIKKAFSSFTEIDATVTETSRTLGMTNDQVYEMNKAAKEVGSTQDGTLFTTKQISQAIAEINNQLGLSVNLGADENAEFAAMTTQMGLAATESANIYKLGRLTNLSLKDTNKAISAQIVAVQKSTGVQINAKQVFQEIGKLNAGITAKFQQNPELIAKAVAQAKALGTSLETLDKIGESLLNWESSIENELKAELITGKQLNFERARAAALTGDQATLMQEVASQVGTLEDFNNMNVIAQKSLAEAFGMSRDELADMLQKQAVFNKLGDVSGKSAAEQLEIARQRELTESDSLVVNLKQQAAAEKLAATFDTIKLAIADLLSGPFSIFVDMMSFLSKNAWAAYAAVGAMAGISIFKLLSGVVSLAASLATAGVSAATVNSALTFGVGAVAVLAAIGAIVGLMSSATSTAQSQAQQAQRAQDGIAPPGRGPFTIMDSFGATAITAYGDGLAVSPNIKTGRGDSGVMAAINNLANIMSKPAPTPQFALSVDGERLGSVVGRQQETGTQQTKNAYRLA